MDIRANDARRWSTTCCQSRGFRWEGSSQGKQSNDIDLEIELSARSDEDVGMEYLMLNLELSGDSDVWDGNLDRGCSRSPSWTAPRQ